MASGSDAHDPFDAIQWDTETRKDFQPLQGHIRDHTMYLPAALWAAINDGFGGVTSHFRTATDVDTGKVTVAKSTAKTPGAVEVKMVGAMNAAQWNVWLILKKLNLTIPANRQLNIPATIEKVGSRTVLVFDFQNRQSVPRNRKEEEQVKAASEGNQDGKSGKNEKEGTKDAPKDGAAPGSGSCDSTTS